MYVSVESSLHGSLLLLLYILMGLALFVPRKFQVYCSTAIFYTISLFPHKERALNRELNYLRMNEYLRK